MKHILILMTMFTMIVSMVGCDSIKLYATDNSKQVLKEHNQTQKNHEQNIIGGAYLRDEGMIGFLWYVPLRKNHLGVIEIGQYRFAQENVVLFLIGILAFYLLRIKKEKNLYRANKIQLNAVGFPPLMDAIQSHVKLFIRAKILFVMLNIVTIILFVGILLHTKHIIIHDIAIYKIIIAFVLLIFCMYLYWHYMMLYTNIYVKLKHDTNDLTVTSDLTLVWVILLSVILSWFGVIGILSGMFFPLMTLFIASVVLSMLKTRTWLSGSFLITVRD